MLITVTACGELWSELGWTVVQLQQIEQNVILSRAINLLECVASNSIPKIRARWFTEVVVVHKALMWLQDESNSYVDTNSVSQKRTRRYTLRTHVMRIRSKSIGGQRCAKFNWTDAAIAPCVQIFTCSSAQIGCRWALSAAAESNRRQTSILD